VIVAEEESTPIPHSALALHGRSQRTANLATPEAPFHPFSRTSMLMSPSVWMPLVLIWAYQRWVPDRWKRACIYEPSCSRYAMIWIERCGFVVGLRKTSSRIRRCDGSRFLGGADYP
jgi:putative component of membrane protein insertase Oxa1/YidC/SpoIIIJ protein YidD